jgi:ketosteroid isomerase-like protein
VADRLDTERLLRGLYAARSRGDLEGVCGAFARDVRFEIAGASNGGILAMTAHGVAELRPLLAIMLKSFKLTDLHILSLLIDGQKAAVHWRARVSSRISGETNLTELIDVIEVRSGRIASYVELFAPR